ncbi:hypothetical protein HB904_17300 [Listeria booriae]|uniref:Uncharacterized protein n=1 Tax=Listeria booriae TaxID=1552123 RepID=A0A842AKH1_9LIST|nr:DUF6037 family protein [Listeria booriae]MBC1403107.1 hypothetical protein [Listeria booriae]MBC1617937.1 hypothetical protein [Listeria booriae]
MIIDALQKLHLEMKRLKLTMDVFELTYNEVVCDVIFEADPQKRFSLIFIKKSIGSTLSLAIVPRYDLQIKGSNYIPFLRFFNIGKAGTGMAAQNFSDYLEKNIPTKAKLPTPEARKILAKHYDVEDSDKTYYASFTNWEKARALNPALKKGRTQKNLLKTKKLYPNLYETIKDYDISINYSTTPRSNEKELLQQLYDTSY